MECQMKKYDIVENLYNAEQSARFLGVHKPVFYKYLDDGAIEPVAKVGRIKLYCLPDLKKLKAKIDA